MEEEEEEEQAPPTPARPRAPSEPEPATPSPVSASPAAALAGVMNRQAPAPIDTTRRPQERRYSPEQQSDDDAPTPSLPARPQSYQPSLQSPPLSATLRVSPPENRHASHYGDYNMAQGGFHLYNVSEMMSVMGKKKKIPTTLGINLATGVITIAPEKSKDGPQQEWTAEKMTHYSIEGKHVFMELVRPAKSIDFHAGAKDTAQEIVASLGEMAGAVRGEGLKEIFAAAGGSEKRKGTILYDFMAQGDDEVTVAVGDEVVILDDSRSEEWWQVRRIKNGKEGVVPSSYVEITGTIAAPDSTRGINAGRSTVEQNRIEEQRLAKEALKAGRDHGPEVGPGMTAPPRGSSLTSRANHDGDQRRRESRTDSSSKPKTSKFERLSNTRPGLNAAEPNPANVRTWTDRSKSFSVEAEFLALKDGKINLHKMNGVKIAVPVSKMSIEDLEYVEHMTGVSLDEDKPLSVIKRNSMQSSSKAGATIERSSKPEYDWFNFFLACEIGVGLCERYSQVFNRDNMDESVLPDVDATVLRNLGLREGDIIKVLRHIDAKYKRKKKFVDGDEPVGEAGLFSGSGGALKNNTRKGRPAPAIHTSDTVDPKAFNQQLSGDSATKQDAEPAEKSPAPISKTAGGFDDDAWDVKPSKQHPQQTPAAPAPAPVPAAPPAPTLPKSFEDLSLLSQPLQPSKPDPPAPQPQPPVQQAPPQQSQPTGAAPSFFAGLPSQPTGMQPQMTNASQFQTQQNIARSRPSAPQYNAGQGSLMPPPPPRPLSAPGQGAHNTFGPPPLQPQMTGIPYQSTGFGSIAPPGQSLAEIDQMRQQQLYMQQQQQMQPQMTGYQMPQPTGFQGSFQPQPTGFNQNQNQFAIASPSPFSDARALQFAPMQNQPTGFQAGFQPQATGINSFLPPALQPQQTGFTPNTNGFGQPPPPMPPMPQSVPAPLLPQKTGPPPPVRFGVQKDTKKIAPQATGRRANLAAASKCHLPHSASEAMLTHHKLRKIHSVSKCLREFIRATCSLVYSFVFSGMAQAMAFIGGRLALVAISLKFSRLWNAEEQSIVSHECICLSWNYSPRLVLTHREIYRAPNTANYVLYRRSALSSPRVMRINLMSLIYIVSRPPRLAVKLKSVGMLI